MAEYNDGAAAPDPEPTFANFAPTIATLELSDGKTTHMVNKDLLCHISPVFNKAFNGDFLESETLKIHLVTTTSTFFFFLDWLYLRKLPKYSLSDTSAEEAEESAEEPMIALYIFADKYDIPSLRNDIFGVMYRFYEDYEQYMPAQEEVEQIGASLSSSDRLYRLIIHIYAARRCALDNRLDEKLDIPSMPAEFWMVLSTYMSCLRRVLDREDGRPPPLHEFDDITAWLETIPKEAD